jgi:hypothetical protein
MCREIIFCGERKENEIKNIKKQQTKNLAVNRRKIIFRKGVVSTWGDEEN